MSETGADDSGTARDGAGDSETADTRTENSGKGAGVEMARRRTLMTDARVQQGASASQGLAPGQESGKPQQSS